MLLKENPGCNWTLQSGFSYVIPTGKLLKYPPKPDNQKEYDNAETNHTGFGKDFGVVLYIFGRCRRRYDLFGAADGTNEYTVPQFRAASGANHDIISS